MNEFRTTDVHRAAMPKLMNICHEASVAHWSQDSPDHPTWSESHRRMVAEGRSSKVNHPSPDHLAAQIPLPRPSRLERIPNPSPRTR